MSVRYADGDGFVRRGARVQPNCWENFRSVGISNVSPSSDSSHKSRDGRSFVGRSLVPRSVVRSPSNVNMIDPLNVRPDRIGVGEMDLD